jgi:hypothetical protein
MATASGNGLQWATVRCLVMEWLLALWAFITVSGVCCIGQLPTIERASESAFLSASLGRLKAWVLLAWESNRRLVAGELNVPSSLRGSLAPSGNVNSR